MPLILLLIGKKPLSGQLSLLSAPEHDQGRASAKSLSNGEKRFLKRDGHRKISESCYILILLLSFELLFKMWNDFKNQTVLLLPKFSELLFENHQEGFVKRFHIYTALRFIVISLAVLAFPGIQFGDCWDGLMGNSHQIVCQPAGGRAALIWKENKGMEPLQTAHWAPRCSASRTRRTPAVGSPEEEGTRAKG